METTIPQRVHTELKVAFAGLPATINTQERVWYALNPKSGTARQAVETVLHAIQAKRVLPNDERQKLAKLIGQTYGVIRNDRFLGPSIHYPEIFASPIPGDDSYYMLCPKGLLSTTAEIIHFVPDGGRELSNEETQKLESALFPAWGGHVPSISRAPISKPR